MSVPEIPDPTRYFTAYDRYEGAPPVFLLGLELLEVDVEDGVVRYSVELADPALQVWAVTLPGWANQVDPAALSEGVRLQELPGGVMEVPISEGPQVTQIEVVDVATGALVPYWVQTIGTDWRNYRYISSPPRSTAVDLEVLGFVEVNGELLLDETALPYGYLVEVAPNDLVLDDTAITGLALRASGTNIFAHDLSA